jgi:hypothetical protein
VDPAWAVEPPAPASYAAVCTHRWTTLTNRGSVVGVRPVAIQPEIAVVAVDRVLRTAINHCEVWYDAAIQMHEANEQFIADRADREKAEADAAQKALTSTPVLLREAMAQANASSVPGLNSAAILRAALTGGSGSINGAVIQGRNE